MGIFSPLIRLYDSVFQSLHDLLSGWFIPLAARFSFASVLLIYYVNSAWQSIDGSLLGLFSASIGSFGAMLPSVAEQYSYNVDKIPFFPYHMIVILGTWGELFLPILIVVGLFTRIAAIGMIIFVIVQTYVDIVHHGLEAKFIGSMFDRASDALIYDQRLLWIFVLLVLVVKGAGKISLDHLLVSRRAN